MFALGGQDDLLMVVRRVEALGKFLDSDDGKNLLAGTKRASNILSIEEKKDKRSFDGAPNASLYKLDEEKALAKAIDQVKSEAGAAVAKEDFAAAMSAMAKLRPAVDAFFDKVKVNDDDAKVRENRLKLLNEIRARRARSRTSRRFRTSQRKAPPGGGYRTRLSSRTRAISNASSGLSRSGAYGLVDHLNDTAAARLDQHGLAVHDGVAVRRAAETLRHVVIGHAGFGQGGADHDAIGNREGRHTLARPHIRGRPAAARR